MKRLRTVKIDLPTHWASYLINNDASGIHPHEVIQIEHAVMFRAGHNAGKCVDVSLDSFLDTFQGLQTELSTYTFILD